MGEGQNRSPDDDYFFEETYRVVKCCGCDHVSFDLECYEEGNVEYDEQGYETIVPEHVAYPKREGWIEPLYSWDIPYMVKQIYQESVMAFNEGNLLLASIGFRATVEAICLEKSITNGKLVTKINKLREKGIITAADCERLHEARFMGNESAHEIQKPDREHVLLVLEVINNILNNLYIIDKKCKEIFEYRFKDYDEFQRMVEEGISRCQKDDEGTIYQFLPDDRKYRIMDLDKFEAELQVKIKKGLFSLLLVLPKADEKKYRQRYKVE